MQKNRKGLLKLKTDLGSYHLLMNGKVIESVSSAKSNFFIEIFPSLKCNLNCTYCDRGKESSVLKDFGDIAILYNNLLKDAIFNKSNFTISGGEPTLYSKINELILFLHGINPYAKINLITNGIELRRIRGENLKKINLYVSIYPYTLKILQKSRYLRNLLCRTGYKLESNILSHENMNAFGKKKINYPAFELCFKPVLLGDTKKVYPCCRAHRLEQDFKKKYHFYIDTLGLYGKLKHIIEETDLCSHCPRVYEDSLKVKL